jgi:uncharacterized protein YcaQ
VAEQSVRTVSPRSVRRLAISSQWLDHERGATDPARLLNVVRQIGCLQLDPISAVARSHQLVMFSRVGPYALADLDHLLFTERSLFEYWAHAASIVLTEDYPIHNALMRAYLTDDSDWSRRKRAWLQENEALLRHILDELGARGPLMSRDFEDKAKGDWYSSGWTSNRNVSQMLDYLWTSGQIMVVGRQGGQKVWDMAERALPEWAPRHTLTPDERVTLAVTRALRALGIATERQIQQHFTRGRYPGLRRVLQQMEAAGQVERVGVAADGAVLPGPWYLLSESAPLLDRIEAGDWHGQTRLLSPFDNLICDRARTETLFDYYFRIEIYVPKAKRQYGYYVLPILHDDRLIGRIDPQMDRKRKTLTINAVYAEPDAPGEAAAQAVALAIQELATFLGASHIQFGDRLPAAWRERLRV